MIAELIEDEADAATTDGQMNTLIVRPSGPGPFPVVLFYMDAPGRREELSEMARRIAACDYYVMLPNLYYRTVRDFQMQWDADGLQRMFRIMETLNRDLVAEDTAALLRLADRDPAADADRIGAVGYCMSGRYAIGAAANHPDQVRCAASFHGTSLVTDEPDSPHRLVERTPAELYFGCAEFDDWADASVTAALAAAAQSAPGRVRTEVYPGARHGFVFAEGPAYQREGAEHHWDRLFSLFARCLGTCGASKRGLQ